jgi:hypothetical protein
MHLGAEIEGSHIDADTFKGACQMGNRLVTVKSKRLPGSNGSIHRSRAVRHPRQSQGRKYYRLILGLLDKVPDQPRPSNELIFFSAGHALFCPKEQACALNRCYGGCGQKLHWKFQCTRKRVSPVYIDCRRQASFETGVAIWREFSCFGYRLRL